MFMSRYKFNADTCRTRGIKCLDEKGTCERETCDCDKTLAICVNASKYNEEYDRHNMKHEICPHLQ